MTRKSNPSGASNLGTVIGSRLVVIGFAAVIIFGLGGSISGMLGGVVAVIIGAAVFGRFF